MNNKDFEKINAIIEERKYAHDFFLKNSNVYRSFVEFEQKTFSDGELPKKYKELIALGIGIVKNCESCMEWHTNEALKSGASFEEIIETINNPEKLTQDTYGTFVAQKVKKNYLFRVFYYKQENSNIVITAYKTSKLDKYI